MRTIIIILLINFASNAWANNVVLLKASKWRRFQSYNIKYS